MQDYSEKWKAERERAAFLVLADGTVFRGVAFGARQDRLGEAVFNTGMSGYQEILTDPSYAGQFVALTTAEIGNYGVNPEDVESRGLFLSGLVVNDLTEPSNYRSTESVDAYLARNGVPGIYGVDVRALTLHLRDHGSQRAWLHVSGEPMDPAEGAKRAQAWEGLDGQDYAAKVSCAEFYEFAPCRSRAPESAKRPLVVCYDFGVKMNILRNLAAFARVVVVPAKTPAESVRAMKPDGVFLSNGPADPAALPYAAANIRDILGLDGKHAPIPTMGICLGHQLLSIACGAKTGRLKFGHHGCNHPVKNLVTGHVEITSQNHNFAVQDASMPDCLEVTHVNLNDHTIEGVRHRTLPAFSVQYHPESCPGPHDSKYLFDAFRKLIGG
ncbi:MAG: glutamine-hydrolyzing carbamoyl-phosphate synthase small subunit [Kiritimatiellae bacterium]|nr:glutamine-hydrolyzing carbamoyl-phosphate synthase small subunit [Kiritimatiellia bacterium]